MRDLTPEDEKYLVKYCMEPKNILLALAIGQIRPKLREKIVSLFLKELDESVKKELKERDCQWQTCISDPETIKKEQGDPSIYVMRDRNGIEIHLGANRGTNLFVGTPKGQGAWPRGLRGFLERKDLELKKHTNWRWWFEPEQEHMSIKSVEALSTLNDGQKSDYFTYVLVRFAKAISKELGD